MRSSWYDTCCSPFQGRDTRFLGKQILPTPLRQHHTDQDFLKHYGHKCVDYDYNTMYSTAYERRPHSDPLLRRRFPRVYQEPQSGLAKLNTTTCNWYRPPDVPHKTPLQTLAISQEPYLQPSKWKYSYHGLPKCYPPYDTAATKEVFPLWSSHGKENSAQHLETTKSWLWKKKPFFE